MTISAISFTARAPKTPKQPIRKICTRCEEKKNREAASTINRQITSLEDRLADAYGSEIYQIQSTIEHLRTQYREIISKLPK